MIDSFSRIYRRLDAIDRTRGLKISIAKDVVNYLYEKDYIPFNVCFYSKKLVLNDIVNSQLYASKIDDKFYYCIGTFLFKKRLFDVLLSVLKRYDITIDSIRIMYNVIIMDFYIKYAKEELSFLIFGESLDSLLDFVKVSPKKYLELLKCSKIQLIQLLIERFNYLPDSFDKEKDSYVCKIIQYKKQEHLEKRNPFYKANKFFSNLITIYFKENRICPFCLKTNVLKVINSDAFYNKENIIDHLDSLDLVSFYCPNCERKIKNYSYSDIRNSFKNKKIRKTFRVSNLITLVLRGNTTVIQINNEDFDQCKYVLLNLEKSKFSDYDSISSIDDLISNHSTEEDYNKLRNSITSEVEFFAHCSNLQVWYESKYDTTFLDSKLSFPMLKRLSKYDDQAKKVFQEEIIKRFLSGAYNVMNYLYKEKYLDVFSKEQKDLIYLQTFFPKDYFSVLDIRENFSKKDALNFLSNKLQIDESNLKDDLKYKINNIEIFSAWISCCDIWYVSFRFLKYQYIEFKTKSLDKVKILILNLLTLCLRKGFDIDDWINSKEYKIEIFDIYNSKNR